MYAPLRCKRRLEDNDGLASAVQLPRRDDNNHAFLIKPVFCRKQVERINAAGPQPPQAPATAAMQRCLAVRPDLADGVRSGPRQTMEEDLFFTRPAHGYFGPALQSWDDRRTGTPLYRIDQFLLTAFQNPLIGAHLSVPPKQRVEVEVILRDPTIVEPHKRFARDNIVAIRDRRSLLDESARPGHYVLAEIWYGQYSDGRLPRSSLVERAYLLHVLARADVRHVVKHAPGVAAYGRTVNELAMKALSEIAKNRALERADVKFRKAQARDEHRGSHADIQRAYNAIEREHQSSRRASEEAVVKRAIRSRIQTRRGDGGGRLTSVRDYAELVLDTTELGESDRYWLVEQFCNLDHADCPANPVRVLSFQRSVDALLELCPGLAGSPQLDYANYVYAENGVRMFPYPDLVFTIDACDFTPERLQRQLLPWH